MEQIKITLTTPIQAHGETLTELALNVPIRAKALRRMDEAKGDFGKACALIEHCAAIPASSVDELDARDLQRASEALAPFLQTYP